MKKENSAIPKRSALCMLFIMLLLLTAFLRVGTVSRDGELKVKAESQSTVKLTAARQRGTIFDTNLVPLTNDRSVTVTAVSPEESAVETVSPFLSDGERAALEAAAGKGLPYLVTTEQTVNGEGITNATVAVNQSSGSLAPHLIGYTDSTGHGVCGVQKAFDSLLFTGSTVEFCYTCDGKGRIVERFGSEVRYQKDAELSGVKLTIDADIQSLAETVADSLVCGAIVVSEIKSGKIRAVVSRPDYDPTDVASYLDNPDSPLLNRAFCAYNVGSAFKPCVAAAALENGAVTNRLYDCVGSLVIEEKEFACHKTGGHGPVELTRALTHSCNTYFYSLGIELGGDAIYNMASSLGLGQRCFFADSLVSESGYLPHGDEIASKRSIANLSIGQGQLMLTPVSMLNLYSAIAGGGVYYSPSLVEGFVNGGKVVETAAPVPTRVMSGQTANTVKKALQSVVNSGTGVSAKPQKCTAAGKTATAQTGWRKDGRAVEHSWFCGFFPADEPVYAVVIISEDTNGGGTPCNPLFSRLADAIFELKMS